MCIMKKHMRQRNSKLMLIPAAFGREQRGADALQDLCAKMGVRPAATECKTSFEFGFVSYSSYMVC